MGRVRLWVLCALLLISGIGAAFSVGAFVLPLPRVSTQILLAFQSAQYLALSWGMVEILLYLHKITHRDGSSAEMVSDLVLEELQVDDPIPESVQLMAKRVQATLAKKTGKTVTIESVKLSGSDYICRMLMGSHTYSFKVAIDKAGDANAWAEQAKTVLQLMTS